MKDIYSKGGGILTFNVECLDQSHVKFWKLNNKILCPPKRKYPSKNVIQKISDAWYLISSPMQSGLDVQFAQLSFCTDSAILGKFKGFLWN